MKSTPNTSLIQLEINGSIANITMARSDKFNAMNVDLISELIEVFAWTAQHSVGVQESLVDSEGNENLRVLVLSGEGKHFCAGADINMMRDAGANTPEENRRDSKRLDKLFNSLWSHPCFTIGCIQGVALGGGAGLISCLDYVIAEKSVKIALSEGKLGILPAVIGPYVYRRIGSAQFRRLAMMAKRIGGEEALRIGMIDELVEDSSQFEQCVTNAVAEVMTTGPMAVAEAKSLTLTFDRWNGSDEELREWTLDKTSEMRGSPEGQEGLASFLEKRSPDWKNEE
jgi:methylglutaconyl-CoA hydratase|tara:strand:+ start:940 stop:1791 length:852 start_codon:yes stop_codon:yes gene_type:complete